MIWLGFPEYVRDIDGQRLLTVAADFLGPDDAPIPCAVLCSPTPESHGLDLITLREEDILWLRDDVFPGVLERMRAARMGS